MAARVWTVAPGLIQQGVEFISVAANGRFGNLVFHFAARPWHRESIRGATPGVGWLVAPSSPAPGSQAGKAEGGEDDAAGLGDHGDAEAKYE